MKPIRVTPPAEKPVSLADLKLHARVDFSDDDMILQAYLDAAVAHLDGYTGILGRCLIDQEWQIGICDWAEVLRLPFCDVSTASIAYVDPDGSDQAVAADLFELVGTDLGSIIWFKPDFTVPSLTDEKAAPITVTFTAGYGATADDVPYALRVAIMQLAATWYQQRETVGQGAVVPLMTEALIAPYRRVVL